MNILFICDEYPPGKNGGIGTMVQVLGRELVKQGHNVYVVGLYCHGFGGLDYEEHEKLKIWRLRYNTDVGFITNKDSLKDKILVNLLRKSGILRIDASRKLKEMISLVKDLISKNDIHIIEMPDWNNFYFNINFSELAIPKFKVPLIIKMHGTLSYFNKEQDLAISEKMFLKENYMINRADALSAVSIYTSNYCNKLYQPDKHISVLYNGIEIRNYVGIKQRANESRVVFSGSLFYKKGIFSLIKAWNTVLLKIPDATLHIYGKGNPETLINLLSQEARKTVTFHGHVERAYLLKQLQSADLAVFPSYSETFGLGVVEAMSVGCPVIFTKRSCGPEIVEHQKEGLLVDPDDLADISQAIITMLVNKSMREDMSLAGYRKVNRTFNISHICRQHIDYYKTVVHDFRIKSNQA